MTFRRWRVLLLLAAALLVPPRAAFARSQYFCRMLERVVSSCCCQPKRTAPQHECELRADTHDCCERIAPLDGPPAHAGSRPDVSVPPALLAVLLAAPSLPVARPFLETDVVHPGRGPPPAPRSRLFIAHCSLLI